MPKYLRAREPHDDSEARKIRRLAGARHAPADWIERARIVALSWDGLAVPAIAAKTGRHENRVEKRITDAVFSVLGVDQSVASRTSFGGTAPENVRRAVKAARERFA